MKNIESVFAAYLLVWAIFFIYQWSVASRIARLRADVDRMRQELTAGQK